VSWDRTWADMRVHCEDALRRRVRDAHADTSRRVHLAFADRQAPRVAPPAMDSADV